MKKTLLAFMLLACVAFFNACSADVELYADYKDIPVIYGLIDASKEVNYVRINRAFSGNNENPINANEVALIADSLNYSGKLDARIVEYKSTYGNTYSPTNRVFQLDTMTVHDKDTGIFYAPDQKVYFTTERFKTNAGSTKYKYQLVIYKDNDTISAETGVVGGEDFRVLNSQASFIDGSTKNSKISFWPGDNAVFYDVKMVFNYKEEHNGVLVNKKVNWDLGAHSVDELNEGNYESGSYFLNYTQNSLYTLLEHAIGGDTVNVIRYFSNAPIDIMVSAGAEELYNYIQVNAQAGGLSQSVPDYTNVSGGYGVFSSRVSVFKSVPLSSKAITDLLGRPWGFRQEQP